MQSRVFAAGKPGGGVLDRPGTLTAPPNLDSDQDVRLATAFFERCMLPEHEIGSTTSEAIMYECIQG